MQQTCNSQELQGCRRGPPKLSKRVLLAPRLGLTSKMVATMRLSRSVLAVHLMSWQGYHRLLTPPLSLEEADGVEDCDGRNLHLLAQVAATVAASQRKSDHTSSKDLKGIPVMEPSAGTLLCGHATRTYVVKVTRPTRVCQRHGKCSKYGLEFIKVQHPITVEVSLHHV